MMIMTHLTRTALEGCQLIAGLPRVAARRLLIGSEVFAVPAGGLVLVEGDPSNDAYILLSGALGVETRRTHLACLSAGAHFGEVGVLTGRARSATVEAIERSDVLRIDGRRFRAAVERSGPFGTAVRTEMARRSFVASQPWLTVPCQHTPPARNDVHSAVRLVTGG
ncbi:cyclic nucleotide-binding domain-containing protein [Iamia sp. SCSIO 61187]|uniref:cyclic nucleotide-binding domain-containing protein n=1 Tax=Iamia sp. SCSIO 61187 TaxID=2722752 RepID=UPI001C62882C|nr:cyclic nucleotide-binding domain-containing protein [Iamia sp. SCSIO 61187]QYG94502.1 cyclic nucleotide-binding domain-containing protein [Iamia sp. SCSIO 61187]